MAMKRKSYASRKIGGKPVRRKLAPRSYARSRFRKGYDRTVGNYGRFSGPSAELKWHDNSATGAVGSTATNHTGIDTVVQGTNEDERIGRRIHVKSIHLRFRFYRTGGVNGMASTDNIRIALIQDTQTNGVQAGVQDVFTTNDLYSFREMTNISRFKILKIGRIRFEQRTNPYYNAGVLTYPDTVVSPLYTWNVKCSIPIEYSGVNGTITELKTNHIYVTLLALNGDAYTNYVGTSRIRYSD